MKKKKKKVRRRKYYDASCHCGSYYCKRCNPSKDGIKDEISGRVND